MISGINGLITNTIDKVGASHLRRVHRKMALASLKEHESPCRLTAEERAAVDSLWHTIGYKGNDEWHRLYKTVNSFDSRYLPNDVYGLEVLPRLNSTKLLAAWDDKAYYPRFIPEVKQPVAIAFVIEGDFYDEKYHLTDASSLAYSIIDQYEKIILKPSFGLEGRGVELIEIKNVDYSLMKDKLHSFGRNYVIQEVIIQHDSLAVYNASSVNPIRVMTLRMNGRIHYLHSTLRFGMPGVHTDMTFINGKEIAHVSAVNCNGEVSKKWFNMDGREDLISNLGINNQRTIPNFDRIIEAAKMVHERLHHFDLIGCDFTLNTMAEPILIEYNVYWPGIILPQYCNGPLFGELTEELVYHLKNKPKK